MVAAVILQNQTHLGVVEVSPSDETSRSVTKIRLDFRSRQTRLDQEPPEPSLHRRLSSCPQPRKRTQPLRTASTSRYIGVSTERGCVDKALFDRHVDGDQRFDRRPLHTQS
jgi:hypothetical protein